MPDAPPIRTEVTGKGGLMDRPWIRWVTDVYEVVKLFHSYAGNPNSNVTAPVGHICLNTSGGANTVLWVKENFSNSTGWRNI